MSNSDGELSTGSAFAANDEEEEKHELIEGASESSELDEDEELLVHEEQEAEGKDVPLHPLDQSQIDVWEPILLLLLRTQSPPEREKNERSIVLEQTQELLKKINSQIRIHPFGSHANGFDLKGSDLDLTVVMGKLKKNTKKPAKPSARAKVKTLRTVQRILRTYGKQARKKNKKGNVTGYFKNALLIAHARVPVLKYTYHPLGLEVDLVAHNTVAIFNTRLLNTYASLHPKVSELGRLVKLWARRRDIAAARFNTLSSYTWALLTIFHLQQFGVIPSLQAKHLITTAEKIRIFGYDCTFCDDAKKLTSLEAHAKLKLDGVSLSELLCSFFERFASMKWEEYMISPRLGRLVRRTKHGKKMLIEDPFETDLNLGRHTTPGTMKKIEQAFAEAYSEMISGSTFALMETIDTSSAPDKNRKQQQKKPTQKKNWMSESIEQKDDFAVTTSNMEVVGLDEKTILPEMISPDFVNMVKLSALELSQELNQTELSMGMALELGDRKIQKEIRQASRLLGYPETDEGRFQFITSLLLAENEETDISFNHKEDGDSSLERTDAPLIWNEFADEDKKYRLGKDQGKHKNGIAFKTKSDRAVLAEMVSPEFIKAIKISTLELSRKLNQTELKKEMALKIGDRKMQKQIRQASILLGYPATDEGRFEFLSSLLTIEVGEAILIPST